MKRPFFVITSAIRKLILVTLILTFNGYTGFSQYTGVGSWNIVNLKYSIDNRWSVFGETQLRSLQFYNGFHYYEYKGGVNYKVNTGVKFSLGLGNYVTYKEGGNFKLPKNNDEFRVWPQLILTQSIGSFKIEQRYRAEFRFTTNGYRNRYRYRLGASLPLGKEKNGGSPFLLSASNELFFTNRDPYFERNRLLVSLNYKLSPQFSFQLGYLHQFDFKINDETGRDFLVVGAFIELKHKPKQKITSDYELKDN
jgi:hypothetical protein